MGSREIQVLSGGPSPSLVTTVSTDKNGQFCVLLPLGEYKVKVQCSGDAFEISRFLVLFAYAILEGKGHQLHLQHSNLLTHSYAIWPCATSWL